jgi:hypothetical protein
MSKRLDKTLADYLVIAISPALIMTLIASLVFFLVEIFYQGNFTGRLYWILTLFIFSAVLIGRIAIEQGKERAALFAVPLAVAALLTMNRFVEFHGALAGFSVLINIGLIALIWWCAHKLTWDCTMIDESEPSSGEGLLDSALRPVSDRAAPQGTGDDPRPPGRWNNFRDRRSKPHAPGVWIVYFSLAALPLFGLGQLAIPAAQAEQRRYAFCLLAVYVASGLGLLLTTSFLGLRRYLRQRRLPMPMLMANTWIVLGCVLIFAVMGLAMFVPRPSAEYAISQLPSVMGSPDQRPSKRGVGRDGVKGEEPGRLASDDKSGKGAAQSDAGKPGGPTSGKHGDKPASGGDKKSQDGQPVGRNERSEVPASKEPSAEAKQKIADGEKGQQGRSEGPNKRIAVPEKSGGDGKKTEPQSGNAKKPSTGVDAKRDSPPSEKPPSEKKPSHSENSNNGPGAGEKSDTSRQSENQDDSKSPPQSGGNAARSPSPASPPPSMPDISSLFASLLPFLQMAFYTVIAAIAVYWAWRRRAEIMAALRGLLSGFHSFWDLLFRRKGAAAQSTAAGASGPAPPRPFADFGDPFSTGMAGRLAADRLVQYSFQALEAWGRENGCPRDPEQTPHEFARNIGRRDRSLRHPALGLADLYCAAAYAPARSEIPSVQPLEELWQGLRARVVATSHAIAE